MVPAGGLADGLGQLTAASKKRWEWRLDEGRDRLLCLTSGGTEVYEKLAHPRTRAEASCWVPSGPAQNKVDMVGIPCSVRGRPEGGVRVMASASLPAHPSPHSSLWEVLLDWGCTWMW